MTDTSQQVPYYPSLGEALLLLPKERHPETPVSTAKPDNGLAEHRALMELYRLKNSVDRAVKLTAIAERMTRIMRHKGYFAGKLVDTEHIESLLRAIKHELESDT